MVDALSFERLSNEWETDKCKRHSEEFEIRGDNTNKVKKMIEKKFDVLPLDIEKYTIMKQTIFVVSGKRTASSLFSEVTPNGQGTQKEERHSQKR